jgi:hypothetical protein
VTILLSPATQCDGKRKYGSKQEAKRVKVELIARDAKFGGARVAGWTTNVYKCPHCRAYHVGRRRRKGGDA